MPDLRPSYVELRPDFVLCPFATEWQGIAFHERLLAGRQILGLRALRPFAAKTTAANIDFISLLPYGFRRRSNCAYCDQCTPACSGSRCFCQPQMLLSALCVRRQMAGYRGDPMTAGSLRMSVRMPEADSAVLARREAIAKCAAHHRAGEGVISTSARCVRLNLTG